MELTPENKAHIDSLTYESLLFNWRFASVGDKRMQGETGDYWGKRMNELRDTVDYVAISKRIGWKI